MSLLCPGTGRRTREGRFGDATSNRREGNAVESKGQLVRELKRQGNAIAMARKATAVATLVTLVTITKESPRATGRDNRQRQIPTDSDRQSTRFRQRSVTGNYNKGKPEGDRP
jgi:hypothetical protein